jgi:cellulose synthase/poly-beta-1,6-N-acetylglucosamine synthase-like glycosyltransferase
MQLLPVANAALIILALPISLASGYLLVLALLSARGRPLTPRAPHLRFDIIVPAHDEEGGITATVQSLLAVDYPESLRRVLVVADNCTDATAERAGRAGAVALVRRDPDRRGKGYALAYAFAHVLGEARADAVVVVDADTVVSGNLLLAFSARLERGALAIQCDNVVGNPDASWRTRLMAIALASMNTMRSIARERLGVSCGLRGNGMCLATRLLKEVPYDAFSLVEDLEYGIRLGLAGHRVHFAEEGQVRSVMVSDARAAASQRRRWEGGRLRLARQVGPSTLLRAVVAGDRVLFDLAVDLLVPPLAYLWGLTMVGALACAAVAGTWDQSIPAFWVYVGSLAALVIYVCRGWWLSGTGLRGLGALLHAPGYLVWKLALSLRRRGTGRDVWVRTARQDKR